VPGRWCAMLPRPAHPGRAESCPVRTGCGGGCASGLYGRKGGGALRPQRSTKPRCCAPHRSRSRSCPAPLSPCGLRRRAGTRCETARATRLCRRRATRASWCLSRCPRAQSFVRALAPPDPGAPAQVLPADPAAPRLAGAATAMGGDRAVHACFFRSRAPPLARCRSPHRSPRRSLDRSCAPTRDGARFCGRAFRRYMRAALAPGSPGRGLAPHRVPPARPSRLDAYRALLLAYTGFEPQHQRPPRDPSATLLPLPAVPLLPPLFGSQSNTAPGGSNKC